LTVPLGDDEGFAHREHDEHAHQGDRLAEADRVREHTERWVLPRRA
jgi:hypothetical protein